jgi:pyrimidine deaminase RibD-like protein
MAQHDIDLQFMKEAVEWAKDCTPKREDIPKVGAIIAASNSVLGRGRRGNGQEGDDEHAEWNAFNGVQDKSKVAGATLYTTLEPCTRDVRRKPLECCTELIIQHQVSKVMVGILDPNQGVTGKGLLRLQEAGIEVALFPHDLSKEIRAINAAFIRSQQTLSATILSPENGEELRTYDTHGTHAVRFKCNNPPGSNTYLLLYNGGLFWPQPGPFREVEKGIWEITAHFGSTGDFTLQLVNAGDLGDALVRYYRKATQQNRERRERLREKFRGEIDLSILGGDFPGIEMNGLPKGFQLEASVNVRVVPKMRLLGASATPSTVARGSSVTIVYEIECSNNVSNEIWLGAAFRDADNRLFFNTGEDKAVSITKGRSTYERKFTIARDAPPGGHRLDASLWRGIVGSSQRSKWIAGTPVEIKIT